MSKIKSISAFVVLMLCGGAWAAVDELGLEPLVWTTFDAQNMSDQGSLSLSWGDSGIAYEATEGGYAGYVGTTSKYPYYKNNQNAVNWGSSESCTFAGVFKAGDAGESYACLFGMGWNDTHVIVGAKANSVKLAWRGNTQFIKTADDQTLEAGAETADVTADLTAGYHAYALVYDNAANEFRVYLDGTLVITKTNVKIHLGDWNTTQGGLFGMPGGDTEGGGPVRNTATRCDDYRIYGVALTATQLSRLSGLGLAADAWSTKADYNATATATFTTGEGKTAWMTAKGGESTGAKHRVNNANESDVVQVIYHDGNAEADKWHPYWSGFEKRNAFTIAAYVNLDDVTISDSKTYGVIWCVGDKSGSEVILAKDGSGNLIAGNFSAGTPVENATVTIDAALVTSGYHLITVEFSTEFGTALTLDDGSQEGAVATCAAAKSAVSNNGLQIGAILSGLTGQCGRADGVAISDVYYYDGLLAKGAVAELVDELATKYPINSDPEPDPDYDAAVGETKYESLKDAVLHVTDGATLKVLRPVTLSEPLVLDALFNGVLDLNSFSIENSGEGDVVSIAYGATVTITGKGSIVKDGADYAITSRGMTTISAANGTPVIGGVIAAPSPKSKVSFAYGYYPVTPVKTKIDWTGCVSNAETPVLSAHHTTEHSYSSIYDLSLNPIQEIDGAIYEADFGGGFTTDTEYVRFFSNLYTLAEVTVDATHVTIPYLFNVATDTETQKKYARIAKAVKSGEVSGKPLFTYTPMAADINFRVTPDTGYQNPKVTANGEAVEPNENGYYHITAVDGGVAIVITAEEIPTVPTWIDASDFAAVEAYNTWASKYNVTDPTTAMKDAFALNCGNTQEAIIEKAKDFKVVITMTDEGPVVEIESSDYNVMPVIKGSATVDGDYTLEANDANARFFKAFLGF